MAVQIVMDHTDTRHHFNPADARAVAEAEERFKELTGAGLTMPTESYFYSGTGECRPSASRQASAAGAKAKHVASSVRAAPVMSSSAGRFCGECPLLDNRHKAPPPWNGS